MSIKINNAIKSIYFYLVSLICLVIMIIGSITFSNTMLKTYVFKAADQDRYSYNKRPTEPYTSAEATKKVGKVDVSSEFTDEEKQLAHQWLEDYKNWSEHEKNIDYLAAERARDAAQSLAMILIATPIFILHWRAARKETKNVKNENE